MILKNMAKAVAAIPAVLRHPNPVIRRLAFAGIRERIFHPIRSARMQKREVLYKARRAKQDRRSPDTISQNDGR